MNRYFPDTFQIHSASTRSHNHWIGFPWQPCGCPISGIWRCPKTPLANYAAIGRHPSARFFLVVDFLSLRRSRLDPELDTSGNAFWVW